MLTALVIVSFYAVVATLAAWIAISDSKRYEKLARSANQLLDSRYEEGRQDEYYFLMRFTHRKGHPGFLTAVVRSQIPPPTERGRYDDVKRQTDAQRALDRRYGTS